MGRSTSSAKIPPRQTSRVAEKASPAQLKAMLVDQERTALLIVIPERVRRERALQLLRTTFEAAGKSKNTSAVSTFEAKTLTLAGIRGIADRLSTHSLFSAKSLCIINSVEECSAECAKALAELLLTQAKQKNPPGRLVLTCAALPALQPLRKAAKSAGLLLEMEALQGAEIERWAARELQRLGINKYPAVLLSSLQRAADENLDALYQMLELLALYVEAEEVTQVDFASLFPQRSVPSEFEVADMLCRSDPGAAKSQLYVQRLLASGVQEFLFLSLLQRTFSQLLRIRALQEAQVPSGQIQSALALPPWIFNKQAQAAARYSSSALQDRLRAILRADSALKNTSLGSDTIFAELAQRLGP